MREIIFTFVILLFLSLLVLPFTMAIDYKEIKLTNAEFENGKVLDINPYDKIIFEIEGTEYRVTINSIGITSYTNDNVNFKEYGIIEIEVSENNRKILTTIPPLNEDRYDYYADERKFEVNYDFYYDIYISLEQTSMESYQNQTARIKIKRIHDKVPEDAVLDYYCAKFYKCPNGERVRYTEMRGQGCGIIASNPFQLCESEYSSCYGASYSCENSDKKIFNVCKVVGEEGTLSYGCDCLKEPGGQCPTIPSSNSSSGGGGSGGISINQNSSSRGGSGGISINQNSSSGGGGWGGSIICTSGCRLNNTCVSVGFRVNNTYCDLSNSFLNQKTASSTCENNFECSTNLCVDNQCLSSNLWQRLIRFLSRLFGR